MARSVLLIFALAASVLCYQSDSSKQPVKPEPYDVQEAYQVYAAVLWPDGTTSSTQSKKLIILAEASPFMMCVKPDPESEKVLRPVIDDYRRLAAKKLLLQRDFPDDHPYELISRAQLDSLFKAGGWQAFYKQYEGSGGYTQLSAVGFNADKTVAVVYAGYGCGGLCGGGYFHILEKKDGKWQPMKWKGSACSWIS